MYDKRVKIKLTVYADVLFMTNFIIDLFLLYLTKKICKNAAGHLRMICGGCIGGIYAVCMFYPSMPFVHSLFLKLCAAALMVFVSFDIRSAAGFLKAYAVFILAGAGMAGISFALFFCSGFSRIDSFFLSNGVFYINVSPIYVICGGVVWAAVIFAAEKVYTKCMYLQANMYKISVVYKSKKVQLYALLDTANSLTDPVTNTAVVICECEAVRKLFEGENFYDRLCLAQKKKSENTMVELICNTPFHIAPYKALGANADVMLCFTPDAFLVEEEEYEGDVLIGLYMGSLTKNGQYRALLHSEIAAKASRIKRGKTQGVYAGREK